MVLYKPLSGEMWLELSECLQLPLALCSERKRGVSYSFMATQ